MFVLRMAMTKTFTLVNQCSTQERETRINKTHKMGSSGVFNLICWLPMPVKSLAAQNNHLGSRSFQSIQNHIPPPTLGGSYLANLGRAKKSTFFLKFTQMSLPETEAHKY